MKRPRIISTGGCLAALLVTGCAGPSTNSTNSLGGVAPQVATDVHSSHPLSSPFSGESLTGTRRHVRVGCHHTPRGAGFSARGEASGPYPGTFTAHGKWRTNESGYSSFEESFTISSGKRTFNGSLSGQFAYFLHCPEISLSNLTFEIEGHNWTGNSTAEISKESLSEKFQ